MRFPAMKASSSMLGVTCLLTMMLHVTAVPQLSKLPLQTFYVPIREPEMFNDMFKIINGNVATPPVVSMIAIAIAVDGTIIWYDHWEDGYDLHVEEYGNTTEVWGDGDASNGCSPIVKVCTNANDFLKSGQSIVIQDTVFIEPAKYGKTKTYNGGDRIVASGPITVVRGGYPTSPGSMMAGSVEVIDVGNWGTEFEAPVGVDIGEYFDAFQFSSFFFMAAYDNTTVTLPDGKVVVLNQGGTGSCSVKQGAKLTSSQPIQVDFITGDQISYYELRWFSAWPTSTWTNSYITPVGDSVGKTKLLLYNPNANTILIDVITLVRGVEVKKTETLKRGKATLTDVIPTGSGAIVTSTSREKFIALSFTDTEYRASDGQITDGQWYDWGFALTPTDLLTNQALVGWGYGCTNNNCFGQVPRSVVWVTPTADCDVYIDYDNSGANFGKFPRKKLTSSKFVDKDNDMSGAFLFATAPNSGPTGPGVPIAVAWGQDPSVSKSMQSISLDLGTVILPFPSLRAAKSADKYEVAFGDTLQYTIKVMSAGYDRIKAKGIKVFDDLDPMVAYVPNSASFIFRAGSRISEAPIPDNASGTAFPFDGEGFTIPIDIESRGASVDIIFNVTVNGNLPSTEVLNSGYATSFGFTAPFSTVTTILYTPMIEIENTVYSGTDNGALCGSNSTVENVQDMIGADVTYCFVVMNTGNTPLGSVTVANSDLSYTDSSIGVLLPGKSAVLYLTSEIAADLINNATVSGIPLYPNQSPIPAMSKVLANDTSSVTTIEATPSMTISNTVYLGSDDGAQCATAQEYVEEVDGASVVYCFVVTNTGNTHLSDVTIDNEKMAIAGKKVGDLAPGEFKLVFVTSSIPSLPLNNVAIATGNPTFASGKDVPGVDDVVASDDSSVGPLIVAKIEIENTVYSGSDDGALCGSNSTGENVIDMIGADVTYCFVVTNTGENPLGSVTVVNDDLSYTDSSIGILSPGESAILHLTSQISADLINNATVTGAPLYLDESPVPAVSNVVADDTSSVTTIEATPSITISNTVYLGSDDGAQCPTAQEFVEEAEGSSVVYCFVVTNTGNTHLSDITIDDVELAITGKEVGDLAPEESKLVFVTGSIPSLPLNNVAIASGNPTFASGKDVPDADDVVASDDSSVGPLIVLMDPTMDDDSNGGDPRKGVRDPYRPPNDPKSGNCLHDSYTDGGNNADDLLCTTEDVRLESITSIEQTTCELGKTVTLNLDGSIFFSSGVFDLGWYIGTDAGDALEGTCAVNGLQQGNEYKVISGPGGSTQIGSVSWGGNSCGDVILPGGGSGFMDTPITVDLPVICSDENEDGEMDISICFTWRTADNKGGCTIDKEDSSTQGALADLYPGSSTGCFCERYDVPNVSVEKPAIAPC